MLLKLRPTAARARPLVQRALSAQSRAPTPKPGAPSQAQAPAGPAGAPPAAPAAKPSAASAADESSTGSALPKLLLALALTAPAGAAVFVKQNPEWNPEALRENAGWVRFRELVLGPEATKASVPDRRVALPSQRRPAAKSPLQTADELSAAISKGQEGAAIAKKADKPAKETVVKKEAPVVKKEAPIVKKEVAKKDESQVVQAVKSAKKKVDKAVKEAEEKVEQTVMSAEKKVEKAIKEAEKEVKQAPAKIKKEVAAVAHKAEEQVKKVEKEVKQEVAKVTAAVVAAEESFEKKVDAATEKARQEISKLADQAKPQELSAQIDKQIHSTTNDILANLKSESDAAASDIETIYLKGIENLDAHALSIRVAQLATEMKHRSKWEAVRLLEALRRMEEDTQQKSAEVLRRQDELHKELLARELRLQEEILTREAREEMQALKKAYSEDLARNVNEQRTSMLTNFQRTFEREKKAIEERHAQALRAKSLQYQNTLASERKARAAELEAYQAQLRALGTVLDSSSTYEAFSHQVHKTSVAALALSDRIEAAAPLRSEIRALREAARNDPFIEVAVKSLPALAVEEGAPSVKQLQERFAVVKSVSRRAALIPENSGIVGQMFGGALSYLVIPPGGPIEGKDTDAVLSRAEFALKAGDIENAVQEMKALSGLPAEVSKDWVSAAETRLAVEQTAKVVKAHVALLAASLS